MFGVVAVQAGVSEAGDCWPKATVGVFLGWMVGALFLATHAKHLNDGLSRWLRNREVAKRRRKMKRRARRQRKR